MICSVLTPSRKHPDGLLYTVRSLAESSDTSRFEHLIRVDDDDEAGIAIIPELKKFPHVHVLVGPRYSGYMSMGTFITELASVARGKWITMLDDDCTLEKKSPSAVNWEKQLESIPDWGTYVEPEFYHLGPSEYESGHCSPVGWFAPNRFWEKFNFEQCGVPCDQWTNNILVQQQRWPVVRLKGIVYNHQREEGRSRE